MLSRYIAIESYENIADVRGIKNGIFNPFGYTGVSTQRNKYRDQLSMLSGKAIIVPAVFDTIYEADIAYDVETRIIHGPRFKNNNIQIDVGNDREVEDYDRIKRVVVKGLRKKRLIY